MKTLLAMAAPILPGKTEEFHEFVEELNTTYAEQFAESRKKQKIRERTFLQSTPQGDIVIMTLEGEHPAEALANFGQGNEEFAEWYVEQVKNLHGLNLRDLPAPELLVDSMGVVLSHR